MKRNFKYENYVNMEPSAPYPNFHAARVLDPDDFDHIVVLKTLSNGIMIYGGPLKSDPEGSTKEQAYRFPKERFTVAEAKSWLKEHNIKYILFEPASEPKSIIFARQTGNQVYDFYLGGYIGQRVDCLAIAEEMFFLRKEKQAQCINIHINSEGGQVVNGVSLVSEILNSDIPIHTFNEGYAMSMAGYIWLSAKKEFRHMCDFSVLMLHAAKFLDDNGNSIKPEDPDEARFLEIVQNQLVSILITTTGKTKEQVQKILSKDSFYNAEECLSAGFISKRNIITYGVKPEIKSELTIYENMQHIAAFYNGLNFNPVTVNNDYIMKNLLARLGLRDEASESAAVAAFDEVKAKLETAQTENVTLKREKSDLEVKLQASEAKVKLFEDEKKASLKTVVEAYVTEAITKGKYLADKKDALIIEAMKNFETFKIMTDSIQVAKAPNVIAALEVDRKPIAEKYGLKSEQLNIEYLEKEAPDKMKKIKADHPDLWAAMEAEYAEKYGS